VCVAGCRCGRCETAREIAEHQAANGLQVPVTASREGKRAAWRREERLWSTFEGEG
jgi:hypothetical protein